MTNYDYMAMGRKLLREDEKGNLFTALLTTSVVFGMLLYLQSKVIQERGRKINALNRDLEESKQHIVEKTRINQILAGEKSAQQRTITDLKRINQEMANRIKEGQQKNAQA